MNSPRLQWGAIWRPALSISVFLLPLGITQQVLVANGTIARNSDVSFVFYFGYLFLGAVAGFGAARLADDRLLAHGAASAALAYALVQGVGIVRHAFAGGRQVNPIAFVYLALLMGTCGMLGAMLERRSRFMRTPLERDRDDLPRRDLPARADRGAGRAHARRGRRLLLRRAAR